jgi:hypothetical protein
MELGLNVCHMSQKNGLSKNGHNQYATLKNIIMSSVMIEDYPK